MLICILVFEKLKSESWAFPLATLNLKRPALVFKPSPNPKLYRFCFMEIVSFSKYPKSIML